MAGNDNIKVIIKVRPLIKREKDAKLTSQWRVKGDCIECINPMNSGYRFVFDEICDETSSTHDMYEKVAKPIVQSAINGFNGTIFAYGQTSSGKTHTMMGTQAQPGITPLSIREIFSGIDSRQERSFLLKVTYIEIYNEKVYDLLNSRNEVKIQEQANGELHIERKEMIVTSEKCIMDLLIEGNNLRKVAETNMNVQSSRSHTIFSIMIESDEMNAPENEEESATVVSMLNLVDLAGSERADATGATGNRLKEGSHINKSLLSLSLVINKLSEGQDQHINYRDSKLTRILQLSLGGNAMTAIICTVTPAAVDETNYTLGFASRAKRVKNKPVINHVVSDALTLKKMKKQISALEEQLENERKQHLDYMEKEKRLNRLKDGILQYKPKSETLTAPNRRKTWAPDMKASSIDHLVNLQPKRTEIGRTLSENQSFKFSEFGQNIEYSDERFESVLNASFTTQPPNISMVRPPKARMSLLKTPKSIRDILKRDGGETSSINSAVASPVTTVDKDNHIRRLEAELEELQYFQQTESTLRSSDLQNIAKLKEELDEKAEEIDRLNEDMNKLSEEISTLKASNQQCIEDSIAAKTTVLQAEKAKREAEQIVSSVQFELEQHEARANRREKELVEQLDSLRTDNGLAAMKERMKVQSDALTKLESDYWQNEKAHKEEIEKLMDEKATAEEKLSKLVCEIFKFQTLQDDYDEVSGQLVDSVQDNDALKKKFDEQTVLVAEFEKKISALEAQLSDSIAIGDAKSEASSADVEKFQRKFDELEGIVSKLEKQCEQYTIENQTLSENLKAETEALAVESKLKNQLQIEVDDLKAELEANDKLGELEAKLNGQKQFYEEELETLKATELEMRHKLQAEIDELQTKLSANENSNQMLNALEEKFNEQKQSHEKELETLKEMSEKRQNEQKETLEEMELMCKDLQFKLDEQKSLNATLGSEREDSIKYCQELMHENSILNSTWEHCRITVQFLNKELEILRRTYTELQMSVAEQELDSLKLQKTICEINETSNMSYLLEATETEGQNQSVQISRRSTLNKVRQSLDVLNGVVSSSPTAKSDGYKEKFESIVDRLTSVIPVDEMDILQVDYNSVLDKFISIYHEFNAVVKLMEIEPSCVDAHTIIASIQSRKNQSEETENAKQLLETEIGAITDKCSHLESQLKEAEERLKSSGEIDKNQLNEINSLRREISELQVKLDESEVAYEALSEKCLQLDHEKNECDARIESLTENSQIQRDQFNELQKQFNENKECLNQLESDELKLLHGKLSETEYSLCSMRVDIERRDEEIAILKNKLQEFIVIAKYMDIESSDVDFEIIIAAIKSLKNQTKDTENAKQLLENEIRTLTNKCSQLEIQLKETEERLESLGEIDKNHLDEMNNLKREISELQAKRDESEVAYKAVSEKCLQLSNEKNEFEAQIESLTQNSQLHRDQFNELQEQFNENKKLLNQLLLEKDELGSLQQQLIETESQLNTMKLNVNNRDEEISILKKKHEEFNEIVKYMEIECSDVDAQMVIALIESLRKQNKDAENSKQLLESEMMAITEKCSQLENQLKEAEERLRTSGEIDKNHLDEINNLKREISELTVKRSESEVEYQALSEKCLQFDHEKKDFEAQIKSLTQNNQIQLDQFDEVQQQLVNIENAKQSLESEIRSITNKCNQLEIQLKQAEEHSKSLGEIDKNRLDEINHLKQEMSELMAKRDESEVAYRTLSEKCFRFEREKEQFEEEIESLTKNSQTQRDQFNKLQQQFIENKERLNHLEKDSVELKLLQQKLIETESELSAMRVNINSRNEEIAMLKKELQEKPKNRLIDSQTTMTPKSSRSSMSPHRTGKTGPELDDLRNENNKLKTMQKSLEHELHELRRSSNQVRKIKRHSTHDDTRRISGFDACMIDIGTQTDPASENCRCSEFCKQIDKLKQTIAINEARYFELKRDTGVDALNEEVARLKTTLTTTKSDLNTTKAHFDRLTDKYNTLKLKSSITVIKAPRVEVSVQTDDSEYSNSGRTFSGEMDLERANKRSEKYKKAYLAKENEFVALKMALEQFKLQMAKETERKAVEAVQLKKSLDDVSAKYSDVKVICNFRLGELQKLNEQLKKTGAELTLIKKKYEMAKTVLVSRTTELEELKQKNQRLQATNGSKNNENVPHNF